MAGGPSKINPPNSQPSNPIHKKATEAQGIAKKKPTQTQMQAPATPTQTQTPATQTHAGTSTSYRYNNRSASHKQGTCGSWCACFGRFCFMGEKVVILFSLLLGEFLDHEGRHSKDKQPSIFGKK